MHAIRKSPRYFTGVSQFAAISALARINSLSGPSLGSVAPHSANVAINVSVGKISHQGILRERTTTQPADSRIKPTASRYIGSANQRRCFAPSRMEVDSQLDVRDALPVRPSPSPRFARASPSPQYRQVRSASHRYRSEVRTHPSLRRRSTTSPYGFPKAIERYATTFSFAELACATIARSVASDSSGV